MNKKNIKSTDIDLDFFQFLNFLFLKKKILIFSIILIIIFSFFFTLSNKQFEYSIELNLSKITQKKIQSMYINQDEYFDLFYKSLVDTINIQNENNTDSVIGDFKIKLYDISTYMYKSKDRLNHYELKVIFQNMNIEFVENLSLNLNNFFEKKLFDKRRVLELFIRDKNIFINSTNSQYNLVSNYLKDQKNLAKELQIKKPINYDKYPHTYLNGYVFLENLIENFTFEEFLIYENKYREYFNYMFKEKTINSEINNLEKINTEIKKGVSPYNDTELNIFNLNKTNIDFSLNTKYFIFIFILGSFVVIVISLSFFLREEYLKLKI